MFFLLFSLAIAAPISNTAPLPKTLTAQLKDLKLDFPSSKKTWRVYIAQSDIYCSQISTYNELNAARQIAGATNEWAKHALTAYAIETLTEYKFNAAKYREVQQIRDSRDQALIDDFEMVSAFILKQKQHTAENVQTIYPKTEDWSQTGPIKRAALRGEQLKCAMFLRSARSSVIHLNTVLGEAQLKITGILGDFDIPTDVVIPNEE